MNRNFKIELVVVPFALYVYLLIKFVLINNGIHSKDKKSNDYDELEADSDLVRFNKWYSWKLKIKKLALLFVYLCLFILLSIILMFIYC
ncbi:hypothetical protein A0H76_849 [Hepatospora eriocheir]|uniref:Uncharacterized protein n=1 Tax=Hepatospora eriocheir TaxID=1081669 RepID=A0A1X0QI73_9MICR|nr:hypothetical protein A0H76_849 [Hepatospora eriocheir]